VPHSVSEPPRNLRVASGGKKRWWWLGEGATDAKKGGAGTRYQAPAPVYWFATWRDVSGFSNLPWPGRCSRRG